jgi:DNA-binding response OmpR family regulator
LLDISMGSVSGLDILKQLREFSNLPVIMFTARADIGSDALKYGADGHLGKPFKLNQIASTIETVCGTRGL